MISQASKTALGSGQTRRPMIHVCSMWHTNKVHSRLFEQLHNITGMEQWVIWPSKGEGVDTSVSELPFGRLIEVPCLSLDTSVSSVWRGKKVMGWLRKRGWISQLGSSNVAQIHSHSAYLDGFLGDSLATALGGVPHTISFRYTTDVKFGFRFRPQATWALKSLVERASNLMVISLPDVQRIVERLGVHADRVSYLGSGVDDDFIDAAILDKTKTGIDPWKMITMGKQGQALKRVDLTIQGCAEAARQIGLTQWSLSVLGITEADYYDTYGSKTKLSLEVSDHVRFLGRVDDRNRLRQLLYEHGLFVLPSKETFGIAYLEAISQCTPVIYLQKCGIDGVFEPGTVGQGLESQTVQSLAKAIQSAVQSYSGMLGPFSVNPVEQFSWENLARNYCKVLNIQPADL